MFYKIFYTDRFVPAQSAGCARACFIFIRPRYRDDIGLHQHELVHVRQFWRNPFFGLFYALSKKFRLASEVEAYREQLKHYSNDRSDLFALFISRDYNLDISQEQARDLLRA